MSESTQPEYGYHTAKGEWRPPYAVKFSPVFVWPPQPKEALKWLVRFGGYLWPLNANYVWLTLLTYFYFQPALSRCVEFRAGWIIQICLRNLLLYTVWTGSWHLLLYKFKVQGMTHKYMPRWLRVGDPKFLFSNQLYDNLFWSLASGCTIWSAYQVWYFWAAANHHVPYVSWSEHPVYCFAWLLLIPYWREAHFYWTHRAIHWKPLYKHVHYLHHHNTDTGPFSGLSMHPVEHIIYFSVVLIHWIVPSHPIHFMFDTQHTGLTPAVGHLGFEGPFLKGRLPGGSYLHWLHHRYFDCNYGGLLMPLDRYFRTFRDGLSDVVGPKPNLAGSHGQFAL